MSQKTISQKELERKMGIARQAPGMAHLPAFGLVLSEWDFEDKELIAKAESILQSENIAYTEIDQVCQALFWYKDAGGELHLHFWE